MEWFVKAFLKASLTWLALGVTLGVCMAVYPAWIVYRPAHMHMNLLGFVAMMIYGIAYHVVPRFTGHPLHSRRLGAAQWWISNVGLALMVLGLAIRVHAQWGVALLIVGGTLAAVGAYAFIYNLWRTIDGRARVSPIAPRAAQRPTRRDQPVATPGERC